VQLAEGVEGMIHISEMSAEKRINHPQDVLRLGQTVKTQVIAIDKEKRQVKLSIKQLVPTGLDEYLAEHKEGDVVTGRMVEVSGGNARVELGEGVLATCRMSANTSAKNDAAQAQSAPSEAKLDLSALSSMLQSRWKTGASPHASSSKPQAARAGEIRSFRIARLDAASKRIELELA
jgi:small subunit ribosomal protein S1